MTWHVMDGGTWREVTDPQVRVSGTWQEIQEGWVRVSGTWQQFFQRGLLNADLTIGNSASTYGYTNGTYGPYGSLSPDTFDDNTSTSRTVNYARWFVDSSGSVSLAINGSSVPDSDDTFYSIIVGDESELLRSSASYTAFDGLSSSVWSWGLNTTGYPTSGTIKYLIKGSA